MTGNVYLVWLEWPEKCFRADAEALSSLRALVPKGSRLVRATDEASFLAALPKATHAIVWHFRREWFARAPRLKVLATPAAGREFVPTEGPDGVTIHFGGFHGAIISETVLAFMLAWSHGLFRRGPLWPRTNWDASCPGLAGKRAVVIGFGRIGRAIAARLLPFGVSVTGVTRHGTFRLAACPGGDAATVAASLAAAKAVRLGVKATDRLYASADWLILALPSDTGTDRLLDAALLAKLPARCAVVNVGRGNAVDEAALASALRAGRLAGAYLDVFRHEPTQLAALGGASRVAAADEDLAALPDEALPPNLVRTPHASAFSPDYLKMCFKELKDEGLV